jgi:hypothetical protein
MHGLARNFWGKRCDDLKVLQINVLVGCDPQPDNILA